MSKLSITPIGTCRIHSPLKRGALRHSVGLDLRRNYGYVHTSAEALQQLKYLSGEKQFSAEAMPVVFRDAAEAPMLDGQDWQPSDLHIVEISSAKSIRSGEDYVQLNYLYRQYADFFANEERGRIFWSLVKKAHRAQLLEFLGNQPPYRMLPREHRELLLGLSIEQQSFKAVKADMEEIAERVGRDRLLFVTHVNALTPDEAVIPSRDRLIRWVRLAAEQMGVPVYDPTAAMLDFGQERALEKGGLDTAHYTPVFFDSLYEDMHRAEIAARVVGDDVHEGEERQAVAQAAKLEASLELGDFIPAAVEVNRAVEASPDSAPLLAVRGLVRSRIGDFRSAIEDFAHVTDESSMSQPMRLALLESLVSTGSYERGLKVAEALLADEFASADLYRAASRAAVKLGKMDAATAFAKEVFRSDRSDLGAALDALKLLAESGDSAAVEQWRREVLESAEAGASGAFEICTWAIEHRDEALLVAGLHSGGSIDKGAVIDLLEDALSAGMLDAVAQAIPAAVAIGRVPRSLAERRTQIFERLLDQAGELVARGRSDIALRVAQAVMDLNEVSSSQIAGRRLAGRAKRILREVVRDVRLSIRDAYRRQDAAEVARIYDGASDTVIEDADSAIIAARSLQAIGREAEAVSLISRAQQRAPDNFLATRWAARISSLSGDLARALQMYARLRSAFPDEAAGIASEVDRFFAVAERRVPRTLRELVNDGSFEEATDLAEIGRAELADVQRIDKEVARMVRALRLALKEIDEGEGEIEDRERVLRRLVRLRPDDEGLLRRLALELMRQFRFLEAAEVWERLVRVDPGNESAERNIIRCQRLAQRRASAAGSDAEVEP